MYETANTFKFSTMVWIVGALLIPVWPISFPICIIMARKSYKRGIPLTEQIALANARDRISS